MTSLFSSSPCVSLTLDSTQMLSMWDSSASPVIVCSGSAEVLAEAWRGAGAELGPGNVFRVTDGGAGREAFSGEGMEALRAVSGFRGLLEVPEQLSGLSSIFTVLLIMQDKEEEPP